MALMLRNGDYVQKGNGLETVSGGEAILQRVLMKLTARRGAFPFLENFGSQLWTLGRMKESERQTAAEQYVAEALANEENVTVDSVTLTAEEGGAVLKAELTVLGSRMTAKIALWQ